MAEIKKSSVPILVAESEPNIIAAAEMALCSAGYRVNRVSGGAAAVAAARDVDVILLDLSLADMGGIDAIRRLRVVTATPIIVCTEPVNRTERIGALHAGADDFLERPFGAAELLARMRAVRRRAAPRRHQSSTFLVGEFTLDLAQRTVRSADGNDIALTATQWAVLEVLAVRLDQTVHHSEILQQVWGADYRCETQYLRQYIAQLRRKLERDPRRPRHLVTEPGVGYRLIP